jgi:hypothetical protein
MRSPNSLTKSEVAKQIVISRNLIVRAHRHTWPGCVIEFKRRGGHSAIDYSEVPFKATVAQGGFVYSILFDENALKSVALVKSPTKRARSISKSTENYINAGAMP